MPKVTLEDGYVLSEYHPHLTIDLDEVADEHRQRTTLGKTPHKLLVKLHGFSHFTAEAQHFIASKAVADITLCAAILFDDQAAYYEFTKQFMDHVVTVHRFTFPVETFDEEEKAIEWLNSQS